MIGDTPIHVSFKWNQKLSAALSRGFPRGPMRQRSIGSFDSKSSAEISVDRVVASKEFSARDEVEFDDTCTTMSTSGSRNVKRVKFLVDDDDDIVAEVIYFQRFHKEDAPRLYWSSEQRQEFVFNVKADADDMQLDYSNYIDQLDEIYTNALAREVDTKETKDGIKSIMRWSSHTEGRGLEGLVMSTARKSRRHCIRNVLKLQKSLPDDITYEDASRQLRKRSRRWSRNAEEFAFLLALGDSAAAESPL